MTHGDEHHDQADDVDVTDVADTTDTTDTADTVDAADVVDVTIERTESVTITFDDGLVCVFPVAELRASCPCATCRGLRERGEIAWPRPGRPDTIQITDANFAGAWGVSISWSDGHDTGIYAWAPLRRWWLAGRDDELTPEAPRAPETPR
ncbi:MAG: DUF971 domain-containing protein [Ilumatobacteraceae bacterium]